MMREKILIADDEPYILDICQKVLEGKYQIKIVRSGLEAIQLAKQEQFDLLLTDIRMPGIDGLETAQELKRLNPDIVCITMTGYSTMETAIKALRLGIDEFVVKPFNPDELTMIIEHALEKERLRKENIRLRSLLPLFEFNKSLMSTVDTGRLLPQVLDLAVQETGADDGVLITLDGADNPFYLSDPAFVDERLERFKSFGPEIVKTIRLTQDQVAINRDRNDSLDLIDVPNSEQAMSAQGVVLRSNWQNFLRKLAVQSLVATPLFSKEKLLGVLILTRRDQTFTQSEAHFLSVMAGQAAVAYENARLFEDLQEAYDELKTLDHLKSEFTNRAAHELRTPLAILMGYVGLLESELTGDPANYLAVILRNALRLRELIEDLLNMRYINSGQLSLTVSDVDLMELIEQIVGDISVLAAEKEIELALDLPTTLPEIQTDRKKIELVLMNLLANAIKFTPLDGTITVAAQVEDEQLLIAVADTGIGIPPDEFGKIFDSFYQIEQSLSREHEGIGLGLAIARGMIERCGGRIWVESSLGQGSTFTFSLPLDGPPAASQKEAAEGSQHPL